MVDVLLVSPRLPPDDNRYCGDNAYTDTMLQYPPPGVRYHHYEDLMAAGQVRKIKWLYRIGPRLRKWGVLPPDLWAEYLVSDFVPDILHIYGFSSVVRFPKGAKRVPLVLGNGTASYSDLKYYLGWDERRIRRARWLKRQYLRLIDAHDSSLRPEKAEHVLVWSEFSKHMHLDEGYVRQDQIEVLYPGLHWCGDRRNKRPDDSVTFLYVGRDFERKNGHLVLEAFRQLRSQHLKARLLLVGIPADGQIFVEPGVTHYHFLPRQELLENIYPQADVLILPSRAEGFGLVLLEAMSFGMPVVAVDAWAMREVVVPDQTGLLITYPPTEDAVVEAMVRLLEDPTELLSMRQAAFRRFQTHFALEARQERLGTIYREVLEMK